MKKNSATCELLKACIDQDIKTNQNLLKAPVVVTQVEAWNSTHTYTCHLDAINITAEERTDNRSTHLVIKSAGLWWASQSFHGCNDVNVVSGEAWKAVRGGVDDPPASGPAPQCSVDFTSEWVLSARNVFLSCNQITLTNLSCQSLKYVGQEPEACRQC